MTLLEHALEYAARGWRVFPLNGKKPRTEKGFHDAVTDSGQIKQWWRMYPDADIGIALPVGIIVLDIDSASAEEFLKYRDYEIPETVEVKSGRGRHIYFKTSVPIKNKQSIFVGDSKLDLKAHGGYLVAPPSKHVDKEGNLTGKVYEWTNHPSETEMAEAPDWLIEEATKKKARAASVMEMKGPIAEGTRNSTIFSIACKFRADGMEVRQISALIDIENDRCQPPMDDAELDTIAKSAAGYETDTIELPDNWGIDSKQLKNLGVDEATLKAVEKVNAGVKDAFEKRKAVNGENGALRLSLVRCVDKHSEESVFHVMLSFEGREGTLRSVLREQVVNQPAIKGLAAGLKIFWPTISRKLWDKILYVAMQSCEDIYVDNSDHGVVAACMNAARDWFRQLEPTNDWSDFPSNSNMMYFDWQDGTVSLSSRDLSSGMLTRVDDSKRRDLSEALQNLSAQEHKTPNGKQRMKRIPVSKLRNTDDKK